ncbi:aldehyde dehydrogenase family protein [Pseudonocardia asaccharolytica]|uniref:Aldehyde dehydrogenase n=1 Tax=Pseudonocardia asaccharolytica DSM 44247 = NBRC 16224 TaxID=1123024 RepID=A0A511D4I3_9PSEU|nr:aldehyde dehydrogenase family protein [Pseudonocardia asaccharolytica]GEL17828.1 aldehyde dehydrogenase [Pseudonocardia asaccharolytica DSM 44247 = NBRC 16224]
MTEIVQTEPRAARDGAAAPVPLRQLVGGRWVSGAGAELVDRNPARPDELVAVGRLAGRDDLDAAVAAAAAAFPGWAAMPFPVRGEILARAADVLVGKADAWGVELAREEGKTRAESVGEVRRAAEILRFFAAEGLRPVGEVFASARPGEQIQVLHRPVGVVAVVTPFNFPIGIPAWKIAPALAYGNTVVWKPASTVPLLAMRLAEALVAAGLPDGVLSLLIGPGSVGAALVEHPGVDRVSFTGSTAVGRDLIARCGRLARPIQTEMGGKNAAAVLADANLDLAVDEVVAGAFRSTGQKCTATSRLIVTDRVAGEFLALLVERVTALRVGDPLDADVQMGPLITATARDDVRAAVEQGLRRPGVTLLVGGEPYRDARRADGAFLAPTVVELAGDDPLWREELFGPVLAVRRARDDAHALELVNDSAFGLSAAVFTDDLRAITAATQTLDVGVLHINSETAGADPHVPFGGAKQSGFGPKEQGRAAREFYTTTTTVYLRASGGVS